MGAWRDTLHRLQAVGPGGGWRARQVAHAAGRRDVRGVFEAMAQCRWELVGRALGGL